MRPLHELDHLADQIVVPAKYVIVKAVNNWKVVVGLYFGAIFSSAAIFDIVEKGRTYWDGIWWAFITGLTIGYGDIYPTTMTGRIVGIVLAHVVILLIVPMIIAQLTLRLIDDRHKFTDDEQEQLKQHQAETLRLQHLIMQHLGITDPDAPERPRLTK